MCHPLSQIGERAAAELRLTNPLPSAARLVKSSSGPRLLDTDTGCGCGCRLLLVGRRCLDGDWMGLVAPVRVTPWSPLRWSFLPRPVDFFDATAKRRDVLPDEDEDEEEDEDEDEEDPRPPAAGAAMGAASFACSPRCVSSTRRPKAIDGTTVVAMDEARECCEDDEEDEEDEDPFAEEACLAPWRPLDGAAFPPGSFSPPPPPPPPPPPSSW